MAADLERQAPQCCSENRHFVKGRARSHLGICKSVSAVQYHENLLTCDRCTRKRGLEEDSPYSIHPACEERARPLESAGALPDEIERHPCLLSGLAELLTDVGLHTRFS